VFECDLRDTIAREACYTGQYEPQETLLLRELLSPGVCFVDVGANWGYHTLLAAHLVGTGGRVISLEPDPRLFPVLERNLVRNKLRQVKALQLAAADCAATLQLAGFDAAQGNFGVSRLVAKGSGANLFEVAARPLDEILRGEQVVSVDLLKMDIEGAEGVALQGLEQFLAAGRIRCILLELHPAQLAERGTTAGAIIARLQSYGYQGWHIAHTLADYRRVAYSRNPSTHDFLSPLTAEQSLGEWPHILWYAPGTSPGYGNANTHA
jgi:FkbM family methyltransferase